MKRYCPDQNTHVEIPEVDAFLEEVIAISKKHGFVLGHEDGHGAFTVARRREDERNSDGWLMDACFVGEPWLCR